MFDQGEDVMYYLALYNENYPQAPMPEGVEEAIVRGLYRFKEGPEGKSHRVHLLGSGPMVEQAIRAQAMLAGDHDVAADVWSATSYHQLRVDALEVERWNRLHPDQPRRKPFVTEALEAHDGGPVIAVSDSMKSVPDQIARWVPQPFLSLGTDGFGRSDTREALRRFFEVDAEHIVVASLAALSEIGEVKAESVADAIEEYGIEPEGLPDPTR